MKTCGVLLGAIFERFDTIIEFSAFHDFISFEKKGKNKIKKQKIIKLRQRQRLTWCAEQYELIKKINECLEIKLKLEVFGKALSFFEIL